MTEDEMVGWHHWLNGHEFQQDLRVGEGRGSLVDAVHGVTESDTTQQLKNSKARFILLLFALFSSCSEVCQEGYGYLFIYFWPCWVFTALHQLSLLAVSEGSSACASHCSGFSCCGAWVPGLAGSVVVAHGLSCPEACGILWDKGWNPCPLHWQADSQPLDKQGSPRVWVLKPNLSPNPSSTMDFLCDCKQIPRWVSKPCQMGWKLSLSLFCDECE